MKRIPSGQRKAGHTNRARLIAALQRLLQDMDTTANTMFEQRAYSLWQGLHELANHIRDVLREFEAEG